MLVYWFGRPNCRKANTKKQLFGHVQKQKQGCGHPKNVQFDIFAITSDFFKQILMKFSKELDNYVANPTTKIFFMKIKATQKN